MLLRNPPTAQRHAQAGASSQQGSSTTNPLLRSADTASDPRQSSPGGGPPHRAYRSASRHAGSGSAARNSRANASGSNTSDFTDDTFTGESFGGLGRGRGGRVALLPLHCYNTSSHSNATSQPTWSNTLGSTRLGGIATPHLSTNATANNVAKNLERALDFMHDTGELFLSEFEVQNFLARREGGQGLVQFVRRAADGVEFAVKFFHATDGALLAFEHRSTLV